MAMTSSDTIPFAGLRPERILDAIESVGYRCDGALMALNSYENRVWQIGIEDSAPVVAKFYRPGRWSDAQIAEEHAFTAAMAADELPVVTPLSIAGKTLFSHGGFRFSVFPRQGGRAPARYGEVRRKCLGRDRHATCCASVWLREAPDHPGPRLS